ncbi:MFS transporter [Jannaschia pohangensis]|uniref:Predicted arabinose efflux permease, MFS family n=1 Tax=Jannaschia pohangensis TaxID=390807 RepID=A0A1I3SE84_9RHOB|nr:MFS transporter [Jannaschia pohangensis]SFJ55826.1 Predicted arabinose efflux permease, MFS family [Jannaschia pohangensis]
MNRNLNLLMAAVGVVGANSLVLAPVSAAVGQDLGQAPADVMQAAAAFGVATAVSALFLAPLIDRIGAGRMMRLALLVLSVALAASGLAPDFGWLLAAQAGAGLASGVALPAAYALAAEVAPPGRAAAALGRVLTGWTLALVFGVTTSAILADLLNWRAVFGLTATAALLLAIAGRGLPDTRADRITLPWAALPRPGVARGLLLQLAMMVAFYGTYSFLGAHLDRLGLSTLQGAIPVLAYGIGFGLAGRFDPWLDRRGYGGAAPFVFAGVAASLVAIATLGGTLTGLTLAFFAWGLANHLGLGLLVGRLTTVAGAQRGAVLGLNSAITYLAVVLGAAGLRTAFDLGGLSLCAVIGAVLAATIAVEALTGRDRSPAVQG